MTSIRCHPKHAARHDLVEIGRRLYARGYIVATDGNLSARVAPDRMLITPGGVCKGEMHPDDLVTCNLPDGAPAGGRPSSELPMHLAVYAQRPDVAAVIHAHPPVAVVCSLAGVDLSEPVLPEVLMTLGSIPTTPFAVPSSPEGASAVREFVQHHDALILDRHGTLTVGADPWEAFRRLERLVFAARVMICARMIGDVKKLTPEQIARITAAAEALRIDPSNL